MQTRNHDEILRSTNEIEDHLNSISDYLKVIRNNIEKGENPSIGKNKMKNRSTDGPMPHDRLYCFCRTNSCGDMIKCDGSKCKYSWFHYACVNVCDPPPQKWYCESCKPKATRPKPKPGPPRSQRIKHSYYYVPVETTDNVDKEANVIVTGKRKRTKTQIAVERESMSIRSRDVRSSNIVDHLYGSEEKTEEFLRTKSISDDSSQN